MMSYTELLENRENPVTITYADLLHTWEWHDKRTIIAIRDNHKCKTCEREPTLNIFPLGHIWIREDHKKDFVWLNGEEKEITWIEYFHEKPDNGYVLHVHHTYYVINRLPWEYPDEDLVTLCNWCHKKVHEEQVIPVYQDSSKSVTVGTEVCDRCNGTGYLEQYRHVLDGICFQCWGMGIIISES